MRSIWPPGWLALDRVEHYLRKTYAQPGFHPGMIWLDRDAYAAWWLIGDLMGEMLAESDDG